jgi:hypothetical protein
MTLRDLIGLESIFDKRGGPPITEGTCFVDVSFKSSLREFIQRPRIFRIRMKRSNAEKYDSLMTLTIMLP